ncbi:manganese catalase family protein [Paraclostridium bifermentans]|uniref:manganese catalase family protein n=1 Tax=Paraclostridium bifermentans TaxID=1490 RepID=UPI0006B32C2F|nr:manganese catalase family protein [Paraclostridium bifermentans]OSB12142.1 rubrerythrin family protein [Paraclostridium bifermentans]
MWIYQKTLEYPVNLKSSDPRMAKFIMTQLGGPNGELAAALRYLQQRYTMPTGKSRALLTDIGTEELAHVEIISSILYQLMKDASPKELKAAGLGPNYATFGQGLQPVDANGVNFTTSYINVFGDSVTNLHEDMAAEQKALATYYQLINLTDDSDLKDILRFLGEREIVHYQRFGEALIDVYEFTESKKCF